MPGQTNPGVLNDNARCSSSVVSKPLACPHCKRVVGNDPPGVFYCGGCGKPYTIPSAEDLARLAKKRADEKRVLMLVGGAVCLVYVMPVLLVAGYMCFIFGFYLLLMIGIGVGAAVG